MVRRDSRRYVGDQDHRAASGSHNTGFVGDRGAGIQEWSLTITRISSDSLAIMSLLRLFSRMFPGPWQVAFGVGVLALLVALVGVVWDSAAPTVFIVPAAFLGIAWVKRSEAR